ncbi:oxygenase MpaB family protein [Longispora sp. K20-0274]|uniref:oxygenase MpaB family protein n=1 Tax=Longispora sp. K20-0274 TaxID=3088255 RepID=UPI003999F102
MSTETTKRYIGQWRFLLAMPRATLLQAAFPQIGAAVVDYSSFRPHLWRRFQNTVLSLLKFTYGTEEQRAAEIARLQRMHSRMTGVDDQGRPYTARDPHGQAWVLLTLFDAVVTLGELSAEPIPESDQELMYAEFQGLARDFGIPDDAVPADLAEFRTYFAHMIDHEVELTEAARIILTDFFGYAPRPALFDRAEPVWRLVRAVLTEPANMMVRGILPEAFRRRFDIPLPWYADLATRGVFQAASLVTRVLPTAWTFMPYAREQLDLDRPSRRTPGFFTDVLDQTGNGFVTRHDLLAMARQIAAQFDVDADREDELYAAFEEWWRHLVLAADIDGDGRVEFGEWRRSAGAAGGLDAVLGAMFRAADTSGDGAISAEEYGRLFGGRADPETVAATLREFDLDADARISEAEFHAAMRAFFLDVRDNTLGRKLLAEA